MTINKDKIRLTPVPLHTPASLVRIRTITPIQDIPVSKLHAYLCAGIGGHTEYVRIYWNGLNESASWNGYTEDRHNLTFDNSFILEAGKKYNYEN